MTRVHVPFARKAVRRMAPIACVVMLAVVGAACGSSAKPANGNTPPAVTTTVPASPATSTTSAPQAGGSGF